ncbi:MAG: hypothetical protein EOO52_13380 [Gammaproteobacteria bacterium]|nr:MAG: hypothetical protein EOO52_13380 [Gammaproteobacteria bacterium]
MLVTQAKHKTDYEACVRQHRRTAAFLEWQRKLNRADRLPRGKFFVGKKGGKPFMLMDEAYMLNGSFALLNSGARKVGAT